MPAPGFYDANANRAFPFVVNPTAVPDTLVVDCGIVMGLQSGFVSDTYTVWLTEVARNAGTIFTFTFASDAPGLSGRSLVFTVDASAGSYQTSYAEDGSEDANLPGSAASNSHSALLPCEGEPLWNGYLVTGRSEVLLAAIAANDSINPIDGDLVLEPALIQNLVGTYVSSLNIGNLDRTRVDAAGDCPPPEWAFPVGAGEVFAAATCLRGQVRFKPGYNATVEQVVADNAIRLGASKGAGEGEPCEMPPLFPGETPPAGSNLLEGGPQCNEVVRSLNGVGGRFASLLGGTGVEIEPVPEANKIIVRVNMRGLAVCYSELSAASETL